LLLSVTTKDEVRLPAAVGENVTLIVQVLFAPSEPPQVLVSAKLPGLAPVNVKPLMDSVAFPVLFSVTAWAALVVPRFWLLNVRLVGETAANGPLPVPVKFTVCGLLVALSVRVNVAVRVPGPVGVNVILMVQLPPAATELPQVFVSEKSPGLVPVAWMPVMVKAVVPVLFRVMVWAPLGDPTDWLLYERVEAERLVTGPLPVPVKLTVCGLPKALSVMLTEAVRLPVAVGAKVTLILQLPPAGTELPQLLDSLKSPAFVPVTAMPVMVKAAVPVLLRVTACAALVVPRIWLLKVRLVELRLTVGPPPVPVRLTLCTLPATLLLLSVMVKVAVRVPGSVGEKVTLMVQLPPAATELPQLLFWPKSPGLLPPNAKPATLKASFPVLVRVTVWAGLVVPSV
jgi:hypothetical protein